MENSLSGIPQKASTQAFIQTGVFVFPQSRCCRRYVEAWIFKQRSIRHHFIHSQRSQLFFKGRCLQTSQRYSTYDDKWIQPVKLWQSILSFKWRILTGFDKDQFHEITESLTSLKNDAVRSIRMSVATFLLKLRTGLSNKRISVLIQEPQIQRIIYNVWPAFMTDFVPGNIGFEHISRKDFCKNHTTQVASSLFSMSRWCKFCFRRYIHLYSNEFRLCFSKTIL